MASTGTAVAHEAGARAIHSGIALVGAPSSIGIRPYDEGAEARRLDLAPGAFREQRVAERLGAKDLGDVEPPPYRDFVRPATGIRNEAEIETYSRALAASVARAVADGSFTLVLGGECSVVLGNLLGAARSAGRVGLAYIDAHADFGTSSESLTGSAASMCLALAVGRGASRLARLADAGPLVRGEDVVLIGRRDTDQPNYGQAALEWWGVLDLPDAVLTESGEAAVAGKALERLGRPELDGFWIHVDADVLNPRVLAAVDSPEPGGPDFHQLAALVRPLVDHPAALGLELTIYDPALDPDRAGAARLVDWLEEVLAGRAPAGRD